MQQEPICARRQADRRQHADRRHPSDRRVAVLADGSRIRLSPWQDQRLQHMVRFLIAGLGLLYFNQNGFYDSSWLTLGQLNLVLGLYLVFTAVSLLEARTNPFSPFRYRLALAVDVLCVSVAVLNDPAEIPPSFTIYFLIALGNGMRYGMRLFGEAVIASFAGAMVAHSLRFVDAVHQLSLGMVFMDIFGAIVLVYAYVLMGRIEANRNNLEKISKMDSLTGLLNRRALYNDAERVFQHLKSDQGRAAVMFADLDKFKAINDTHGHATGDVILKECATILRTATRDSDIVARFGGDEFVLILPGAGLHEAQHVGERIQSQMQAWAKGNNLDLSLTIGVGEAPIHGDDLNALLHNVDAALYHSKHNHGPGGLHAVNPSSSAAV